MANCGKFKGAEDEFPVRLGASVRSSVAIQVIGCHAEGEVGDVIVGGVAPPPGASVWEQSRFIAADGQLRALVLNEPRGGVFRHVNLLVPPKNPRAQMGFIIMEPEDTPPMSGSNCICVATVLLDAGIIPMTEPETHLMLEAPAGLVEVTAKCRDGKAQSITLRNVPAFADRLSEPLEVEGLGTLSVDTAFGGDSFVMAANEKLGFSHPELPDWRHFSFAFLTGPLEQLESALSSRNACVIKPGKIDRSPTGTGCSALMAVLHARGLLKAGERYIGRSIIESRFIGEIAGTTGVGGRPAIIPTITGRGWITGQSTLMLDPDDPFPHGYRLADTWPKDALT